MSQRGGVGTSALPASGGSCYGIPGFRALTKTTLQIVSKEYARSSLMFPLLSALFMTPYHMHLKSACREGKN